MCVRCTYIIYTNYQLVSTSQHAIFEFNSRKSWVLFPSNSSFKLEFIARISCSITQHFAVFSSRFSRVTGTNLPFFSETYLRLNFKFCFLVLAQYTPKLEIKFSEIFYFKTQAVFLSYWPFFSEMDDILWLIWDLTPSFVS